MTQPWTASGTDLDQIFDCLRPYACVVLAVSGGSDSMALLHLAAQWVRLTDGATPRIRVATIDHGLRESSAGEALWVADAARALGLESSVLTWTGEKPAHGIQEKARAARYELLGDHAHACGVRPCAVVTAHTRDDQAETVLMRLARGSGPDGLQGMARVRGLRRGGEIDLVRPLLGLSRAQLRTYLAATSVRYLEDPSNDDARFERVRLRAAAGAFESAGLTPQMIALAAQRQRRAVDALEAATDRLQRMAVDCHGGMFASIDGAAFAAEAADIRVRLMGRVLTVFGGASSRADLAQVEHLVAALAGAGATLLTLGGCEVRACRSEIRVYRERGRAQLHPIELRDGEQATWDDRFRIRVTGSGMPILVRALDPASARRLRRGARFRLLLPARAAATLPSAWAGDDLISVGGVPPDVFTLPSGGDVPRVDMTFVSPLPMEPP